MRCYEIIKYVGSISINGKRCVTQTPNCVRSYILMDPIMVLYKLLPCRNIYRNIHLLYDIVAP